MGPLEPSNESGVRDKKIKKFTPLLIAASAYAAVSAIIPTLTPFTRKEPQAKHTSPLKGAEYVRELIESAHPERVQEVLRMQLKPFKAFCNVMRKEGLLKDSVHGHTVEEQVAIFLHIVGQGTTFRNAEERFQLSIQTIHGFFHEVLDALVELAPKYIKPPSEDIIATRITSDPKYYPFFNDCLGAVDGTHIAAKVFADEVAAYRNRKGFLSQNVMACCDLDTLTFTYVLAGWEGSAHDGLVFEKSFDRGFSIPQGKYYLGDAGYPLAPYCLTPYRGERYHLKEWERKGLRYVHYDLFC